MPAALFRELAEQVDDWLCLWWRRRPEVEGHVAAEQVEVGVVDPFLALLGEVVRDAVRAGVLGSHVLDDLAVTSLSGSLLGLSLLKRLGGLGVSAGHFLRL